MTQKRLTKQERKQYKEQRQNRKNRHEDKFSD